MDSKIAALSNALETTLGQAPQGQMPGEARSPAEMTSEVSVQADLRLVIEEDGQTYIYKMVDRATGEVVAQYPREEVLKLHEDENYVSGNVITTRA